MVEVIPSINVRTFEEVQERVKKVEPYVKWCHLDVTDGVFSKHPTWNNPSDLATLKTTLKAEAHLMVRNPDEVIDDWFVPPVARVILHAEVIKNFDLIVEKCRDRGIEVGVAINPETSWEVLRPYFGKADILQILAVSPGPSGQKMGEEALGKASSIRKSCPKCIIEVDGGINPETAKKAVKCGANLLVAGSAIFSSVDIKLAIGNLRG